MSEFLLPLVDSPFLRNRLPVRCRCSCFFGGGPGVFLCLVVSLPPSRSASFLFFWGRPGFLSLCFALPKLRSSDSRAFNTEPCSMCAPSLSLPPSCLGRLLPSSLALSLSLSLALASSQHTSCGSVAYRSFRMQGVQLELSETGLWQPNVHSCVVF